MLQEAPKTEDQLFFIVWNSQWPARVQEESLVLKFQCPEICTYGILVIFIFLYKEYLSQFLLNWKITNYTSFQNPTLDMTHRIQQWMVLSKKQWKNLPENKRQMSQGDG